MPDDHHSISRDDLEVFACDADSAMSPTWPGGGLPELLEDRWRSSSATSSARDMLEEPFRATSSGVARPREAGDE